MSGPVDDPAASVRRLAVLLTAGVAPASAWAHAARVEPAPLVAAVASRAADGSIPEAITAALASSTPPTRSAVDGHRRADTAWRAVAAAWEVADRSGAPLAATLTGLADTLRDLDRLAGERATALAGPAATSRLVMVLPPIGLLFGAALGFDSLSVLLTTPAGWACLILGGGLLTAARAWNRRLLRAATPTLRMPGLAFDLTAIAVAGGAPIDTAVGTVDAALRRAGLDPGDAGAAVVDPDVTDGTTDGHPGDDGIRTLLDLSRGAGVPIGTLLRDEAQQRRMRARDEGAKQAARLGVTLMLPLALCVLPAFMALGVVPLMVAVVSSTFSL